MRVYDSCRFAIKIVFLGFILIAIGTFLQNESVNIFYTFKSVVILFLADWSYKLGSIIINNIPIIFMLNIVCKRANSGYPVVLAVVGYFTFIIVTSLFSNSTLASTAYLQVGASMFNTGGTGKLPLETGLIGSFIVAYLTRLSFIRSRHNTSYNLLGFLNKDTAGIIYNVLLCGFSGFIVSYVWPFVFNYLQFLITFISNDLADPLRIALYGVLDRLLSIFNLNTIIRQPFWYSTQGGSLQTISGQYIIGDVNIWNTIRNTNQAYAGAGRFITPFYVINMFIIPGIYASILFLMNDKQERKKYFIPISLGIILSFIFGNPLPIEFMLLFTSPLLFVMYLLIVGTVFYLLSSLNIFLGSSVISGTTLTAMPGNFPDFIINLRNINYISILGQILIVGLISFIIIVFACYIYFRFLSYDIARTGKTKDFSVDIINSVGGVENIKEVGAGFLKVCLHLVDLEKVDVNQIQELDIHRVTETRDGIDIECGSSCVMIVATIKDIIKKNTKK